MLSSSLLIWRRVAASHGFTPPGGRGLHSVGDSEASDAGGGGVGASPGGAPRSSTASPRLADARFDNAFRSIRRWAGAPPAARGLMRIAPREMSLTRRARTRLHRGCPGARPRHADVHETRVPDRRIE